MGDTMMVKRVIRALLVAAVTALTAAPAFAGNNSDHSILERLSGEWVSDGDAFGAPASTVMVWAPDLGGKFVRLDYRIEMQRGEGEPSVFQGVAFYKNSDGDEYKGFWADNSGDLHSITAAREGGALIAHWGVEGAKQGRSRYELMSDDEAQVTDWIKTPEGWRQFNHNTFTRVSPSDG